MGRSVYAEEHLLEYLRPLGGPDTYNVGLILGQSTESKDFVVHLARTLPVSNNDVVEETPLRSKPSKVEIIADKYFKSIKDIDINLIADHAKQVTRMLPGGMWVLGIFIVGPEDCLSNTNCVQKLKLALSAIHKNLASNVYLCGSKNQENLILSFNSVSKQYVCKSVEANNDGALKTADWKFQKKCTKWHQLESLVELDNLFPIFKDTITYTLKMQLQDILRKISDIVNSTLIVIEGKSRSPEDLVEAIGKKKKNSKDKNDEDEEVERILQVGVYAPCALNNIQDSGKLISCNASMRLMGQLVSKISLHEKASIEEATNAIKQDILRSLASRLELHWDSVIEEENGSPEENITLHEPPRRVLVELPENKITLSDYLFPGEELQESLIVVKELLDLDIIENQVQKDVERQADPSEFYYQNEIKILPLNVHKETISNSQITLYIGAAVALFAAIIAILIHQLYSQK